MGEIVRIDGLDGKYAKDDVILKTSGLSGCHAVIIYASRENANEGILTHYLPTRVNEHIEKLQELLSDHPSIKNADFRQAIILYPITEKSPPSEFEELIKNELGNETEIKKVIYWRDPYYTGERMISFDLETGKFESDIVNF